MDILLNDIEARVIGALIEKERTTPDYYPMTLNSLTNACNQKSNRNPVVSFDETTIVRSLDSLQEKGLSEKLYKADSRVPKYKHLFDSKLKLSPREVAILCELILRGPQTLGELRGRCERMYKFDGLQEVEEVVTGFINLEQPMVVKLPRQAGRKERRYMHLLSGEPEIQDNGPSVAEETATVVVRGENARIEQLEEQLSTLRLEFDTFMEEYKRFKSQFD